jgi:two-component system nitrogen regulation sensor histidine kinase NtrY
MTLQRKFLLYLVVLHLVFAGCTIWFLRPRPVWLIAVEIFFIVSFTWGVRLLRAFFGPLGLIRSGASYIREGDFTSRFAPTGQPDMDQLVDVYNHMVDSLREERIHNEEQDHLLRKVMAKSPGGMMTLDVDGRIATVNPAAQALLGLKDEQLIGRPLSDIGTPFSRRLTELTRNESKLLTLRGNRRVRCQAAVFMDRGFERRFLLLDELTHDLHRSEKNAYEKLIRMMSHEVNNTSGAVQSLLQSCLAYSRQLSDGDRDDFVRAMDVAIHRTANLDTFMSGFADVVRLPRPRPQPCDPWEIASQVGLLFHDRLRKAGVTWREDLAAETPPVHCDPVQMEQVLVNLVKNALEAIEAGGEPGEILLRGGHAGPRPFLAIRDTGVGLAPDVQPRLFTPFFTTRQNGQGIGLTMVQEILLGHGFDFTLENGADGGAEFILFFSSPR